ncbi:MAG: hypothetical protein U0Y68_20635 [Blastocatellia bacterium]
MLGTVTIGSGLSWDGTTLSASGSGATTALDNLASVNINAALLAQTGVDLGSTLKPFSQSLSVRGELMAPTTGWMAHRPARTITLQNGSYGCGAGYYTDFHWREYVLWRGRYGGRGVIQGAFLAAVTLYHVGLFRLRFNRSRGSLLAARMAQTLFSQRKLFVSGGYVPTSRGGG